MANGLIDDGVVRRQTWVSLYTQNYRFNILEDAVLTWSLMYHPLSVPTQRFTDGSEWAAWIYRNSTGQYFFVTETVQRFADGAYLPPPDNFRHRVPVGWVHTHPRRSQALWTDEFFSASVLRAGSDYKFTNDFGFQGFLVTPSGVVRRLAGNVPQHLPESDRVPVRYEDWLFGSDTEGFVFSNESKYVTTYIENIYNRGR